MRSPSAGTDADHFPPDPLTHVVLKQIDAPPLALSEAEMAVSLHISPRQLTHLVQRGRIPPPVQLGARQKLWSYDQMRTWAKWGFPTADRFANLLKEGDV